MTLKGWRVVKPQHNCRLGVNILVAFLVGWCTACLAMRLAASYGPMPLPVFQSLNGGGRVVWRWHVSESPGRPTNMACSWARPAIQVRVEGECFYSVSSLSFLFLFLPCPSLFHLFYYPISFLPSSGRRHKMTHKGYVVKPNSQSNPGLESFRLGSNELFHILIPPPDFTTPAVGPSCATHLLSCHEQASLDVVPDILSGSIIYTCRRTHMQVEDLREMIACLRVASLGGSVGWAVRLETRRSQVQPLSWGQQHSLVEIDHEIFSMVILSLPLI